MQECCYWHWYLYHAMCHTKHISILLFQAIFYLFWDYWRWFHPTRTSAGSCISHSRFQNGNLRLAFCRSVVVSVSNQPHRKTDLASLPFTIKLIIWISPTTISALSLTNWVVNLWMRSWRVFWFWHGLLWHVVCFIVGRWLTLWHIWAFVWFGHCHLMVALSLRP